MADRGINCWGSITVLAGEDWGNISICCAGSTIIPPDPFTPPDSPMDPGAIGDTATLPDNTAAYVEPRTGSTATMKWVP
ncbi:hypothetical protein D3C76_1302780 [compost metagenome]